jgi:hypothetical protein
MLYRLHRCDRVSLVEIAGPASCDGKVGYSLCKTLNGQEGMIKPAHDEVYAWVTLELDPDLLSSLTHEGVVCEGFVMAKYDQQVAPDHTLIDIWDLRPISDADDYEMKSRATIHPAIEGLERMILSDD